MKYSKSIQAAVNLMPRYSLRVLGAILWSLSLVACAGGDDGAHTVRGHWVVSTPQALQLDCAQVPDDLSAELWVSGNQESCPLTVDLDEGTTSGTCQTVPGRVRVATLDWFVFRSHPSESEPVRVLLAQAQSDIDLEEPSENTVTWTIEDDDIQVTDCLDVTSDPFDGETQVELNGQIQLVCDLDGSCGGSEAAGCSNLGEICNGTDPLQEP